MDTPERTPDGHWLVIDGRRWRAADPAIPEALRAELVRTLMAGRRAVRDADDEAATARARAVVQAAKVALGERGEPWWEPTDEGRRARLRAAVPTLLRARDPHSTICPSDAARAVGGEGWRSLMDAAREVAAELAAQGRVEVRQRGAAVDPATARGPLRLARGPRFDEGPDEGTGAATEG